MNLEKIAAEVTLALAKEFKDEIKDKGVKEFERTQNFLKLGFFNYMTSIYKRCSTTKTILYKNTPVKIDDIYVNNTLQKGKKFFLDNEIIEKSFKSNFKGIISGTGGSGKSMLAKYAVLQSVRLQDKKIPIFFELRKVNKSKNKSESNLLKIIWADLNEYVEKLSYSRFCQAVESGQFIFILDGLDEIDHDIKSEKEEEIRYLTSKYTRNSFFIFSRPDDSLVSWHQFSIYEVKPMEVEQVIRLVDLVDFDDDQKRHFISDIKNSLYRKHRSFISVPLLATMMLMTYEQYAKIPEKKHVFYGQVYEVLFSKHDVRKDGKFERKFFTSLPIDDFSRVFQAFCAYTYFEEKFEFNKVEILEYIESAIEYCALEVDKNDYLNDLLQSVCLLVQEGGDISFSHRSFQEYFTSLFIVSCRDVSFDRLYSLIENRIVTDDVIIMLYGLDKDLISTQFLKPNITNLLDSLKLEKEGLGLDFLEMVFDDFVCSKSKSTKKRAAPLIVKGKVQGTSSSSKGRISFSVRPMMGVLNLLSMWFPEHDNHSRGFHVHRFNIERGYMFSLARYVKNSNLLHGLKYDSYNFHMLKPRIKKNRDINTFVKEEVGRLGMILDDISELERNKKASIRKLFQGAELKRIPSKK